MKKILLIFILFALIGTAGCASDFSVNDINEQNDQSNMEDAQNSLKTLLDKLGEIESAEEYEADYVFIVDDKEAIDELQAKLIDATDKIVNVTKNDIGEMRVGGPRDASWVTLNGNNGMWLELYINDSYMPADLVCFLEVPGYDTEYYGYELSSSFVYQDIKAIMHKGEKINLGER